MVNGKIPAATYAEVMLDRNHMDQSGIFYFIKKFLCAIRGMVIDYNNIERKITFLAQGAHDCILHRPDSVEHRDHHRRCDRKLMITEFFHIRILEGWRQICPYSLEMFRAYGLHLYLDCPVLRIHIIKLLFARLAAVSLDLSIKVFIDVDNLLHPETKVVKRSPLIVLSHRPYSTLERSRPEDKNASEVEIVPQCTLLAVYERMLESSCNTVFAFHDRIMVCIQHVSSGVLGNADDAVQSEQSHLKGLVLGVEKHKFLADGIRNTLQCLGRAKRYSRQDCNS